MTETKQLQLEYWTAFRQLLLDGPSPVKPQKPLPQHWTNFALGKGNVYLSAAVNTTEKSIRVQVTLGGPQAKARFALLQDQREAIEREMHCQLSWEEIPGKKESRIALRLPNTDPGDRSQWPKQHQWMKERLELLRKVFAQRAKELDAEPAEVTV